MKGKIELFREWQEARDKTVERWREYCAAADRNASRKTCLHLYRRYVNQLHRARKLDNEWQTG